MRIAFIGKGGSGKTSMCAAFIKSSQDSGKNVIGFDVDINVHLAATLGIPVNKGTLIERSEAVFNYLEPKAQEFLSELGTRPDIGALPVSENTNFISCRLSDSFIKEFANFGNGLAVFTAGKYHKNDIGNACYHAKLFSSQLISHRLLDSENDIIAYDATAGTDPVATSLLLAYDLCVVVVEPTLKSVKVYHDFLKAADVKSKTVVLVNKVRSDNDIVFVQQHIPQSVIVGALPFSRDLKSAEQGDREGLDRFSKQYSFEFNSLIKTAKLHIRDKTQYFQSLHAWFSKYAEKWYDPLFDNKISAIKVKYPEQIALLGD